MHDELIERRLRSALQDEVASLPFTITAAELQRRAAVRRRGFAGRRVSLLLAAAVAIGLVGVGGALSGLFTTSLPTPTALPTNGPLPTDSVPSTLQSLDELVAIDPGSVIVAQAHGPADGPKPLSEPVDLPPASVTLGTFDGGAEYRVSVACVGSGSLQLDIRFPLSRGPRNGPSIDCDGAMHDEMVDSPQPQAIGFALSDDASWRAIVRGPSPASGPQRLDSIPASSETQQELVRWDGFVSDPEAPAWGTGSLLIQEVGVVPTREGYNMSSLCTEGPPIRFILGDVIDGSIVADTETLLACDPTRVRDAYLSIPLPDGSRVYVAATPEQQLSLLVTTATPPVALTQRAPPRWVLSGGVGPQFSFEDEDYSITLPGVDGGGEVYVVLTCTGSQPIAVTIDVGKVSGERREHFEATCSPEGATTGQSFDAAASYVTVSFDAPARSWTAMSVLIPDPNP